MPERTPEQVARRAKDRAASRESARRAEDLRSLAAVQASYDSALGMVEKSVKGLLAGASALAEAHKRASTYRMSRHGVDARLRPTAVRRALVAIASDLGAKLRSARDNGLDAPDGTEEAYSLFVSRIAEAAVLLSVAVSDADRISPAPGAAHPALRALMDSAARASSFLDRLVGAKRHAASSGFAATSENITSERDVSFY